ncbi:MAG: CoA transferase [Pseudomonadota bacterium]
MSETETQRVGVIVIHGVGETYEGWTDTYLIPRLERWMAHDVIGATPPSRTDRPISLRLDTQDDDIVLVLPDDAAFERLCTSTGLTDLGTDPRFTTHDARFANQATLIEELERLTIWRPSGELLAEFQADDLPCTLGFAKASEVHRVRDPESSKPLSRWQSYTRRWRYGDRQVVFSELHWADMSKVGNTVPSRALALLQLFLESPYILGRAFMRGPNFGPTALISALIYLANWLMRWPIAGLNVAVFVPAFFAVGLVYGETFFDIDQADWMIRTVAIGLLVTIVGGYLLFRQTVHRKVGLADLALSGALCGLLLLISLGAAYVLNSIGIIEVTTYFGRPETYLTVGTALIVVSWLSWTAVINVAAALVIIVGLRRLLIAPRPGTPRLARPAAAISLSLLLGIVWKFVLTVLGLLVISVLVPGATAEAGQAACVRELSPTGLVALVGDPYCTITFAKALLLAVAALNAIGLVLVLAAALTVFGLRGVLKWLYRSSAIAGRLNLPRLIASPLIVATLFLGSFINVLSLASIASEDIGNSPTSQLLSQVLSTLETPTSALLGFLAFSFVLRRVVELSNGFVHVGRDLVDHQYDPGPWSTAVKLTSTESGGGGEATDTSQRYRRRLRIQRRLEALIEDVVSDQDIHRLVFLAHSQGTVIMHDYLVNHDDLITRQHDADTRMRQLKSIDILTVGSPLQHLYSYYFHDYDRTYDDPSGSQYLMRRVRTWTNMWRVDDPIGQRVTLMPGIENIGLPPGGHLDYWSEPQVCQRVWDLVRGDISDTAVAKSHQADDEALT